MKALIIALALIVTGTASAEVKVITPVLFQSASTYVPSTKVCTANGNIYHKTKATIEVTNCDESSSGYDYNCKTVSKALVQPMKSKAQRCAKYESDSSGGDCLVWESYALNQGVTGKITVYASEKAADQNQGGKVTTFAIPACKGAGPVPAN